MRSKSIDDPVIGAHQCHLSWPTAYGDNVGGMRLIAIQALLQVYALDDVPDEAPTAPILIIGASQEQVSWSHLESCLGGTVVEDLHALWCLSRHWHLRLSRHSACKLSTSSRLTGTLTPADRNGLCAVARGRRACL